MDNRPASRYQLTARKLRRILRFLEKRKIPVKIKYFWTNSLNMNVHREYTGVIKSFNVESDDFIWCIEYKINITFEDGTELQEHLDSFWVFDPWNRDKMKTVRLHMFNSGPECIFTIERLDYGKTADAVSTETESL